MHDANSAVQESLGNEVPVTEWKWLGYAAHLIVGSRCQFHLATVVGDYVVSTVGEYLPYDAKDKRDFDEVGAGRLYETMVFRTTGQVCHDPECNCGGPVIEDWMELEANGYNLRGDATEGHMEMCRRWAAK